MIKQKSLLLFFLLIASCITVFSKELPKTYDVPVVLSKSDQRKIEQADEKIKAALDLWKTINHSFNPDNANDYRTDSLYCKEGLPLLWKASALFNEGNLLKYNVYHKGCLDFFTKHRYEAPSGLENAKAFQKEAVNYLQKAQLNRRSAENFVNEYKKIYDRFFEAFSLEIIAVKKEGRALQIYMDWPIHYAYVFDEDVEQNLFKPIVATVVPKKDTSVVQPVKEQVIEVPDSTIIYYSVQIAAHTVQMSEQHIHESIYKGDMKILEIHEDGWFKYLIGHYKTLEDAASLLNALNVEKAFVVAYKNGRRVPLKEVKSRP